MTTVTEYLHGLIKDHGAVVKVVHSPSSEHSPRGHLLLQFGDDHVEIAAGMSLCRTDLDRIASCSGLDSRKIDWALKQSKKDEFVVWSDPHFST